MPNNEMVIQGMPEEANKIQDTQLTLIFRYNTNIFV